MKTKNTTVLLGVGAVTAMVLVPRGAHAQPSGGDGGGGPPEVDTENLVYCPEDGSNAHYDEFLSGEGETMVRWAGSSTGCPNHINWKLNPNGAAENPLNESIPAYPMMFANNGTTDLSSTANTIGVMRNGVAMFSSWARGQVVEYEDTAFYMEADTFDPCGGHATMEGSYHYHGTAGCLQEQAGGVAGQHSPVLGWALDGFPFYGQLGPDGIEMKSCGFDESFFPFTANCFRGCCPEGVTCSNKMEACGDDPAIGYTDDHVPQTSVSLAEQYDATLIDGDDVEIVNSDFSVDCTLLLGAGGDGATDSTDPSGASGAYGYAGIVLSGAITAATAVALC